MYSQILRNLNRALKAAQNEKISLHDRDFILFLIQKHIKKTTLCFKIEQRGWKA